MAKVLQIFKCELCGNIVETVHEGQGSLTCCGQPMKWQEENTVEAALEKHVPVIAKVDVGFKVTVGSVAHPMADDHYIEWIQLLTSDGRSFRQALCPTNSPEATFCIDADSVTARAYCNLHGLWKD